PAFSARSCTPSEAPARSRYRKPARSFFQHGPAFLPAHSPPAGTATLVTRCDEASHTQRRDAVGPSGPPSCAAVLPPFLAHVQASVPLFHPRCPERLAWQPAAGTAPHAGTPVSGGSVASGGDTGAAAAETAPPSGDSTTGSRSSRLRTVTVKLPPAGRPYGGLCPTSSSFGTWPAAKCHPFGCSWITCGPRLSERGR